VSLRYSRAVKALIATGLAASTIGMATLPAAAGSLRGSEWWMSTLGVRNSWPVSRGAGITVAVLSDGVDTQHPDLNGSRFITGPDYTGTGQRGGQFFGEVGTGIAGLIAAHGYGIQGQNGIVGEVPLAKILSVRVTLPPNDPMLSQSAVAAHLPDAIAQGIRYAAGHGATVIDLPLDPGQAGITGTGGATAAAGGSPAEAAAVKYALSRNVVLVAPAGDNNLGSDAPNYPAAYPGVIAVGAFDKAFVKAPWTSHQSYVTVTAAGSGMTVATNTGSFQSASSTSYASAVVTGIVAMLQGRFPGITVAQVQQALIKGTMFHGAGGHTNGSGYGTVNAQQALTVAAGQLAPASSLAGAQVTRAAAPAAPVAVASRQGMVKSIERAGIVAGGLLVLLLLLVALYVISSKRRAARKRSTAAPAAWSRQGVARHPRAGAATDTERMAEFFASPVAEPVAATAGRSASRGLRPPAAERVFSGPSRPAPLNGDRLGAGPPPQHAPWEAADPASRAPIGPASKPVAKRAPVSGAPPWEEALPPDGDLPWATASELSGQAGEERPLPRHAETALDSGPRATVPPLPTRSAGRHQAANGLWSRSAQPQPQPAQDLQPADFGRPDFLQPPAYQPDPVPTDAFPAVPAAGSREPTGFDSPAGPTSRPGQSLTGRLEWGREPEVDAAASFADRPRQLHVPGGPLPVRQPRPTPPAALSPSGSLWERAAEPAEGADEAGGDADTSGRPIFVWGPPDSSAGQQDDLAPQDQHAPQFPDWRLRGRRERP
jgi:hypothetical protein